MKAALMMETKRRAEDAARLDFAIGRPCDPGTNVRPGPETAQHVIATKHHFPHGWKAAVFIEPGGPGYYTDITSSPLFDDPREAIHWGQKWVGWPYYKED